MSASAKLIVGAVVVAAAIGYLAYLGASTSWQYYLLVDESVRDGPELVGKQVRIAGRVVVGSLAIEEDRSRATFDLAGQQHQLHVACLGPLPDNLAEDMDVVVEGTLQRDAIQGDKVITRCASKYESKGSVASAKDHG